MLKKIRWIISLSLVLIGTTFLLWATLPLKRQVAIKQFQPAERSVFVIDSPGKNYALSDTRQLRLEWPPLLRIGDNSEILLNFKTIAGEPQSTLPAGIVNVYDHFNIMTEARIEVAGIKVEPSNTIMESMPAGQPVRIKWVISTNETGIYNGRIWLSLRLLPLDGSPSIDLPYFVSDIKMNTTNLLGLSGLVARLLGGIGIVSGVMLASNDILTYIRRQVHKIATANISNTKGN